MARSGRVCGKSHRRHHHFYIFSRRVGRDSYSVQIFLATKILHLIEAFCQPTFLFAQQQNHHLIFFLLETVNNLVQVNLNNPPKYKKNTIFQYQFDGNAPLVYCVIRRRKVFHQLAALPTDENSIDRVRCKRGTRKSHKTR